jgi:hypothetical protein
MEPGEEGTSHSGEDHLNSKTSDNAAGRGGHMGTGRLKTCPTATHRVHTSCQHLGYVGLDVFKGHLVTS